jgi:mono/diheme cytochrome c family protein
MQSGCLQFEVSNSFTNDAQIFDSVEAITVTDEASARFAAARDVFERKCTGCHHSFDKYSESELSAWVTAGSADDSVIYQYLKGSGLQPASMPTNSSLSDADRLTIKTWIDGMNITPSASPSPEASSGGTDSAASRFEAVQSLFSSKCYSCHGTGSSSGDFQSLSEQDFIDAGFAVPGSPVDSSVYYRLKGGGGGASGTANMPKNSGTITSDELEAMAAWINGLE